jgi:hypothetical protein
MVVIIWVMGLVFTEVDRYGFGGVPAIPLNVRQLQFFITLPASQIASLFPFTLLWLLTRYISIERKEKTSNSQERLQLPRQIYKVTIAFISALFVISIL